ncbi:putative membrane protein [Vogesella perlucida]|nr:putative membrane protein [Vogesella perlucida]
MSDHGKDIQYLAEHLLHTGVDGLANRELQALMRISRKLQSVRPEHALPDTGPTLGERLADRVAEFGGSWTFIMIFAGFLFCWAFINSELLGTKAFDPYPYIFLNLMLSMLAAIQAPIIMMSQNRQAARDRMTMIRDFEVNLKAEAAIDSLHKRMDHLTWEVLSDLDLIKQAQREQLRHVAAAVPVPTDSTPDRPDAGAS